MKNLFAWTMVVATVLLTTYGQLVIKWQVTSGTSAPPAFAAKWPPVAALLLKPWIISALLAAFAASLCWMLAMSRLELSRAYPFMALNFILVSYLAVPFFGEAMTGPKVAGLALIIIGLIVSSQG
ncbi:EamA family transporter [Lysobacter maris]|uniref:EamA family transporter n=1 Tax=Marilutibacter maris TaxID=1605891 RepID=A0A508AFJ4_9GAMM|nr:EamA family transporter [Lysobacter maris]KAB8179316.1 EamA family transporter [Lysobacter maris]